MAVKQKKKKKNNQYTGAVMFDTEKAIDREWHHGLIYKLHKLDIPSYITYWIQNFINDRNFFVQINKNKSKSYILKAGIPEVAFYLQYYFHCTFQTSVIL
jgi:hypothetical protein